MAVKFEPRLAGDAPKPAPSGGYSVSPNAPPDDERWERHDLTVERAVDLCSLAGCGRTPANSLGIERVPPMLNLRTTAMSVVLAGLTTPLVLAEGQYYQVNFPPSDKPGELRIGVTHTLWIPSETKVVRGIIVHQHGCGVGACKGGETAAFDLHWQALARQWDCGLLGPSYQQAEDQDCRLWCDPRKGSSATFVRALKALAERSGHPEVATAPWCLWGHSGGGFWASLLQMEFPERIVAIWFQSGTAHGRWVTGEIEAPDIPDAAMEIPMMACPGLKERDHERFKTAWYGSLGMFKDYRSRGAPIAFAPDPKSGHETRDSRYLAIPFFDACLQQRLPAAHASAPLKKLDQQRGWLASAPEDPTAPLPTPVPFQEFEGNPLQAVWLPTEAVAKAWRAFLRDGEVADASPPPPPERVRAQATTEGMELTWRAGADLESGIGAFEIHRDGKRVGRVPEQAKSRFGRPLFQRMSYHDTPEAPVPAPRFVDKQGTTSSTYTVTTVNSVGQASTPTNASIIDASSEDAPRFKLWDTNNPIPKSAELFTLAETTFHVIKKREPERDRYSWLHGVAIAWHKNQLYASFGHNTGPENTAGEVANGCLSTDGGRSWSQLFRIGQGNASNEAVSHGVYLSHAGRLWAFHGAFSGRLRDVHTRAYLLNENTGVWQSKGVVARHGFWPMQPPRRMENGEWIMPGLIVQDGISGPDDLAGVAISRDQQLLNWDVVPIPKPSRMSMWGEASLILRGNNLLCISRYRAPIALVARSDDYGHSWTTMQQSNLPMAASQPFAGTLTTGQDFLIGSISGDNGNRRSPLTIVIRSPKKETFDRIYLIRHAIHDGPGESAEDVRLSYPYAVEHAGKLYVAYSNDGGRGANRNSAELAIIPIESFQRP